MLCATILRKYSIVIFNAIIRIALTSARVAVDAGPYSRFGLK